MPNTIRIKRRAAGGGSGAPASMANAELAFNEASDTLYYGKGTGGANGTATSAEPIGGKGAFVDRTSTQSIAGTKTFNDAASFASGLAVLGGALSLSNASMTFGGTSTVTVPTPTANGHAATKAYVDDNAVLKTGAQSVAGIKTFTNRIEGTNGLKIGTSGTYPGSAGQAVVEALVIDGGSVTLLNSATISVPTPTADGHAANKGYVDAVARGLDWKQSVKVSTAANITLSGSPQTIDSVQVVTGDRVLVKSQTAAAENGIYVVAAGAWTRATDFDATGGPGGTQSATAGATVFVSEGTTLGNSSWTVTTNDPITLGTTGITWAQVSGGGSDDTGKNVGDEGIGIFTGKVGNELEMRKLTVDTTSGLAIDAPGALNGSVRISVGTIPLANGGLGTAANSADGLPLITGGTCTFVTRVATGRGGTNNDLSTAADGEIAVTETNAGQKRIATTSFGGSVGVLKRTSLGGGAYGYSVDTATYLTDASTIDGGSF